MYTNTMLTVASFQQKHWYWCTAVSRIFNRIPKNTHCVVSSLFFCLFFNVRQCFPLFSSHVKQMCLYLSCHFASTMSQPCLNKLLYSTAYTALSVEKKQTKTKGNISYLYRFLRQCLNLIFPSLASCCPPACGA